jgi:hypothetical protein
MHGAYNVKSHFQSWNC